LIKDPISERQLAAMCSKGSKEARRVLYDRYSEGIYALCLRYLSDEEESKDLLQDAFIRIFSKIGRYSYSGEGSLRAWMSRIASNMAIDTLRKGKKLQLLSLDNDLAAEVAEDEKYPNAENIPENVLLGMVESLSESKRLIFNMYCIDGYSHKDIALRCGISEKGSASLLAKARKDLAQMVKKYISENE
jgi:RNA polymerase sigma-70 factor (ECF subfamily)